ncbi:MAG TPA: DUF983 domain-containing protein [Thermodesulfobacteriota bacterium]
MGVGSSLLDRPSVGWRLLRTACLVARLRCPSCGLGRMGAGGLAIHRRCPVCGVVFERDPGEVAGGIWVNSMATTLGICGLATYLEFFTALPRALLTPLVVLFAAVFPVAFYRHSRAVWIGVLHMAGLVHRDEAADPEPVIRPWPPDGGGGGGPATGAESAREPVFVGTGRPLDGPRGGAS